MRQDDGAAVGGREQRLPEGLRERARRAEYGGWQDGREEREEQV
jgi:hypothetical protein